MVCLLLKEEYIVTGRSEQEYPEKKTFRDSICAVIDKTLARETKRLWEELLKPGTGRI